MIWLFCGTLLISLSLSYAWWTKVRVINLRQDIFDYRDTLFDRAADLNRLDDPAYCAARKHLNGLAAFAHVFSVPVIAYALFRGTNDTVTDKIRTDDPTMQSAIDQAMEKSTYRMVRYVRRETVIGIVGSMLFSIALIGHLLDNQSIRWIRRLVLSDSPDQIAEGMDRLNIDQAIST